jgi:Uma2 family endonuclease
MSTAVATQAHRYTPEDLLAMPDGKSYELVNGQLVERKMGAESSRVGGRLYSRLDDFCDGHNLGIVWPADNGYQCFPHAPGLVRRPDVSFVRRGRLPGDVSPKGWVRIPPDLAVEVVSPKDLAGELEEKLDDYRKAGVPLVWVIYPEQRKARIFHLDGPAVELMEDDELSGEDVIPGFRCPLREILPRRAPAEESPTTPAGPNGAGPD